MSDKFLGMLGLARRAGKAECGEGRVLSVIRCGRARALIIASDASPAAKKKFLNSCRHYGVPYTEYLQGGKLGSAVGIEYAAAVAVTDENFAGELIKLAGLNDGI